MQMSNNIQFIFKGDAILTQAKKNCNFSGIKCSSLPRIWVSISDWTTHRDITMEKI